MSVTRTALLRLRLVLATAALARLAYYVLGACESRRLALVQLFQRDFVFLLFIGSFPRTSSPRACSPGSSRHATTHAHTEHLLQNIVQIYPCGARPTSSTSEGGHAMSVVQASFFII